MHPLEVDLRYLGVLDKAVQIAEELGPEAAVRYVRSSYHLLSKVYHPDLHRPGNHAAQEGQKRLNAVKERLDATSDQDLARFLAGQVHPRGGHPRILVVEDEDGLRENLADLLHLEGYHVKTAANGVQGMGAHLSFRPELVITDVVMPIMDGVEMVRTLRGRDPMLKVIFISGFFGTRSIRQELMDEIERFGYPMLSKPFKPSRLFELVQQALVGP
jgi:CheY-like chemotaxis protein